MSDLMQQVNERSRLAGSNRFEMLLFSLGKNVGESGPREVPYGINVFKVREVIRTPEITKVPGSPAGMVGMVSLRGVLCPVIDLSAALQLEVESSRQIMVVAEFNRHVSALLVDNVDNIIRLDWANIKEPPAMLEGDSVTAVTELADGRIIQILDVEKVLSKYAGNTANEDLSGIAMEDDDAALQCRKVFLADDSSFALNQIENILRKFNIPYESATNGNIAWQKLDTIANLASREEVALSESLQLIILDIEMPGMDGYSLTSRIKTDPRFIGVPVLLHSSISSDQNKEMGRQVGADGFLAKFDAVELINFLRSLVKKQQLVA